jgi:DNA mismatch endonuclease (patch repair protein)
MDRSANMRAIRSKGMKPELLLRRLVHKLGYRFRLHAKDLPGKPDLVFRSRRKAIFMHGCFWHQHTRRSCKLSHIPKSNLAYWQSKLERNVLRDSKQRRDLHSIGWDVLVIWECEVEEPSLERRIHAFMSK